MCLIKLLIDKLISTLDDLTISELDELYCKNFCLCHVENRVIQLDKIISNGLTNHIYSVCNGLTERLHTRIADSLITGLKLAMYESIDITHKSII